MRCFASTAMEAGMPDQSSEYAEEGTRAHAYAAYILGGGDKVEPDGVEMVEHVNAYAARVRALVNGRHTPLLIEQRVDMRELVPECWGTSDVIVIADDELIVDDLKYGMGERVDAEGNEQGLLYAVGAFLKNKAHHEYVEPFKQARIIIDQPRLGHLSEWTISIPDLLAFADRAERAAVMNIHYRDHIKDKSEIPLAEFNPGVKQCRWCKAYAICPAAQATVQEAMRSEYEVLPPFHVEQPNAAMQPGAVEFVPRDASTSLQPLTRDAVLARAMGQVEYIEKWCASVRAAAFTELQQGRTVPGFKLVQGRQGNRAWRDEDAVEAMLKAGRVKQAHRYSFKLLSPPALEKLLSQSKPLARRWAEVEQFITRAEGGLSVAPENDERAAYTVAHEYEAIPDTLSTPVSETSEYA